MQELTERQRVAEQRYEEALAELLGAFATDDQPAGITTEWVTVVATTYFDEDNDECDGQRLFAGPGMSSWRKTVALLHTGYQQAKSDWLGA